MGESRTELLQWLNDLLQINYSKVEQCGTGGAYCQVFDSIYGDVPMARVKMNAKHEYEFLANYKILQNVFKTKKLDKPILVDKLVKCKMQDNLEFLQWVKRFWDQNSPGQPYDAVARRKGAPADALATIAPVSTSRVGSSSSGGLNVRSTAQPGRKTPLGGPRAGSATGSANGMLKMQEELRQVKTDLEALEMERNFYFNKLRDIEILVQQQLEHLENDGQSDHTLKSIQEILYKTEDGFEPPETEDQEETF